MAEHALDPLSSTRRLHIGVGAGKGAHGIAGILANEAGDAACPTDSALGLQFAASTTGDMASVYANLAGAFGAAIAERLVCRAAIGIGLAIIAKCIAGAGATTIIAADVDQARLDLARELGATHTINSRTEDPVACVREITGKGADFALEASGRPEVLRQAIDCLGIFGTCGIVGATKEGTEVAFNVNDVMIPGRRIMGIVQGDVVAKTFIPVLIDLYKQGSFPFDRLVRFYRFDEINQAVEDPEKGITIKPILRIAPEAAAA